MLNPEVARRQLDKWRIKKLFDANDNTDRFDDDDGEQPTRFVKNIGKLPAKLARIGYGLFRLTDKGTVFTAKDREQAYQRFQKATREFDGLSSKERVQILTVIFPKMAADMNRTWELLRSAPYTTGWAKKAFRAPLDHSASLDNRREWLSMMFKLAEHYQEDHLTPKWLAEWVTHIEVEYSDCQREVGCLLAGVIDAGGKAADEVLEILRESARNEHEIGGMGRHVIQALLLASRPDGWELIERMLLAAQRQEGLRQSILETIDLTHPEAYVRMLRLIREHNLARFSAVAMAVNIWFGFSWDAASTKVVNEAIDLSLKMLEDPSARAEALQGTEPTAAYFSLWAAAFENAHAAIPLARKLLDHQQPEIRFVGCTLLGHLQLAEANAVRDKCLEDEDLRVAYAALEQPSANDDIDGNSSPKADQNGRFERLERLFQRVPEKPKKFDAIVWPWTAFELERKDVASHLLRALGGRPPTRLLPYVGSCGVLQRRELIGAFAGQKKWNAETRAVVIGLAGDSSADVRSAAFETIAKFKLTDPELVRLESTLTRKSPDLRKGMLELVLALKDDQALASSDRLLSAKDANQRQAGLELVRQLFEHKREPSACRERVTAYRKARNKLSQDEQTQISAVLDVSEDALALSLENALGLMDPDKLTPIIAPRAHKVKVFTEASLRCLKSLDDLIHKHREEPIVTDPKRGTRQLLGTIHWEFPTYEYGKSPEKQAARLPLREVWENWRTSRSKSERDTDGLELWRALQYCEVVFGWSYDESRKWMSHKSRKALFDFFGMSTKPLKLKYKQLVKEILEWLLFLHPAENALETLLDISETVDALVPEADLHSLVALDRGDSIDSVIKYIDDDEEEEDWRQHDVMDHWMNRVNQQLEKCSDAEFARAWAILRWQQQPVPGALPDRPDNEFILRAYRQKLTNLHDFANDLAGPRGKNYYSTEGFSLLISLTARRLIAPFESFLSEHPEVAQLVDRCRTIIIDTELHRGETATVATTLAEDLSSIAGVGTLVRILTALGKSKFKRPSPFSQDPNGRSESLTHLASISYPMADESSEICVAQLKAAVKAEAFPEDRLLELAFLAPQWAKIVEDYCKWKGMAEALYWFMAHMQSWRSDVAERAAESAGLQPESDDSENETDDEDEDDSAGEDSAEELTPRKLSPWERLILERTTLTEKERADGAVDVGWFRRVHGDLGAARWKQLATAARLAADANQAKKAQLLADVLLGEASLEDLIKGIKTRYLKEYVRLLGLFPLPTNAKRDTELKRRFDVLQEYGRYAKTLSGLTKPEAMRSLQIGLRNLAGTAGYPDPIRLEWALGADSLKDLARGPVAVAKDGVTVTLTLDERTQPQITIARGDKPLKAAPPAVKKDKAIAALFERAKDLKQQVSRQKVSLEAMMCRGESVSASELVSLCGHALVAPHLERLVFVGEGVLGYPDKNGKVLRNHAGKLEPIKKSEQLRIAHPHDLLKSGDWDKWQRECFQVERVQPFKQIFRELYIVTKQEKADNNQSRRYAGQQVNPRQALALWGQRGWSTDEGVFKTFHEEDIVASVSFHSGIATPAQLEGLTIGAIDFRKRDEYKAIPLAKVPPHLFSEVMRDMDLVVSVAHAGGVDPEATASTVEMRTSLLRETCKLLSLKNVRFKASQAVIDGQLSQYTVHLGSGTVHRMPGGSVCIVPVHSQHRGRLFLPFADDDPRTAEVMSKVLMLAKDSEILDPSILDQLRA